MPAAKQTPSASPVAYSYIRFSSKNQSDGDSIRRQTARREAWLKRNKVKFNTTLSIQTIRDEGVSARLGLHHHKDNADRYGLAGFLAAIEAGLVPRGSFLLIENLDRLTREDIRPAFSLFNQILDAGVHIVQLEPEKVFRADATGSDAMFDIMAALYELSRAGRESERKAELLGSVWADKKRRAAAGEVMTPTVPGWCRVEDGKIVADPAKAETVRRIYRLATEGFGIPTIVKRLNAEKVPTLAGRTRHGKPCLWSFSTAGQILSTRAVLGEYQPFTQFGQKPEAAVPGKPPPKRKRVPVGEPVKGYYPAVVTEAEWLAARAALSQRRVARKEGDEAGFVGRAGRMVNVFAGLLHDARDGGALHVNCVAGGRYIVPYHGSKGKPGVSWMSFPAEVFEGAIFSKLREIDPREVLPKRDQAGDAVLTAAGRLADVEGRIERIKAKLTDGDGDVGPLVDVLRTLDAERKQAANALTEARQRAANPLAESWGEARSLLDALAEAPDPAEARTRLRAAVRRIVSGVWCLFVTQGRKRLAAVQIWFEGGTHRNYLIYHQSAVATPSLRREPVTDCESYRLPPALGKLDMRKPDRIPALAEWLLSVGLAEK